MNTDTTLTLNQNTAQCLKSVERWGTTQFHNVCNGAITEVPWGMPDYGQMIAGTAMLLFLVAAVAASIVFFWKLARGQI